MTQGFDVKKLIVTGLSQRRGSAKDATSLYQETEDSLKARTEAAARRKLLAESEPRPARRPNKKERRQIIRFSEQPP